MSASDGHDTSSIDLTRVQAQEPGPPSPEADEVEKVYVDAERALKLKDLGNQISQRESYAFRVFVLLCVWLIGMFAVLGLQGFKCHGFLLSDNVLLALIGGTTANVFGLFLVVMNYLFPKK